ncbi:MAG: ParB N-terminal domain-containing protein [Methyloligellaceae bacterium]
MHYRGYHLKRLPKYQRITSIDGIEHLEFIDGLAEVEIPAELLGKLPLKNHERGNSPRLRKILRSIRANGYSSIEPIVVRIGRRGRWVIVDGGHRLTAATLVAGEFWTNLFTKKVGPIIFYVYETPISYTKLKKHPNLRKKHRPKKLTAVNELKI